MTGEELERTIEFLLHSQAKHDAQLSILTDKVDALTTTVNTLVEETREGFSTLTVNMQRMADAIAILGISQIDLKRRVAELEKPGS